MSLNFAGFSHLMVPREDLGIGGRIARRALALVHGRFQLDRLARFNERFGPQWHPRYLVWRDTLSLPRLALRVLQAEPYLDAPVAPPMAGRWRPQPMSGSFSTPAPVATASSAARAASR